MEQHKALAIRLVAAVAIIYVCWNFVVRPAQGKLDLLKESRSSQQLLISEAGLDFDTRRDHTQAVHTMVFHAGDQIFESLSSDSDQDSARAQIGSTARAHGIEVNRIEPLRMTEFTNTSKSQRFKNNSGKQGPKPVRFKGEGIRVELVGDFSSIAGFLHDLSENTDTVKLENFRMVSSGDGNARMIAQFMKFELSDAPITHSSERTPASSAPGNEG